MKFSTVSNLVIILVVSSDDAGQVGKIKKICTKKKNLHRKCHVYVKYIICMYKLKYKQRKKKKFIIKHYVLWHMYGLWSTYEHIGLGFLLKRELHCKEKSNGVMALTTHIEIG